MSSSPSPHSNPYVYRSVIGLPEFQTVQYSFDWVSIFAIFTFVYTIPCIFIFLKIVVFYFNQQAKIKQVGLRIEIFQAFLLMQFFNILWIIGEFLTFRIPYTKLMTSYCATENPQLLLKIIAFIYYFGRCASQLLTVLFCGLRVGIVYSSKEYKRTKVIHFLFIFSILTGLVLSAPNIFSEGVCMQVADPYPFGSVLIISRLYLSNSKYIVYANLVFTFWVTFSIVVLTYLMVRKVRERKRKLNTFQFSVQNSRMKKTLTTPMFILLVPLILNLSVSFGELIGVSYFSYILLLRPIFLDGRVHIVTCYFYWTHPVFKTQKSTVSPVSREFSLPTLKTVELRYN